MSFRTFTVTNLIPSGSHVLNNVPLHDLEALGFLGKRTLAALAAAWQELMRSYRAGLDEAHEYISLTELGLEGLRNHAAAFEDLDFEPENLKAEGAGFEPPYEHDRNTTLNKCGWCKYSSGRNIPSYGCYLLQVAKVADTFPKAPDNLRTITLRTNPPAESPRFFFSPCWIKTATEADLRRVKINLLLTLEEMGTSIEEMLAKIAQIKRLASNAEDKPALSAVRDPEDFPPGMHVMVYITSRDMLKGKDPHWLQAVVGEPDPDKRPQYIRCATEGLPDLGMFCRMPQLLSAADYKYLKEHPDFAAIWAQGAIKEAKEDAQLVVRALAA